MRRHVRVHAVFPDAELPMRRHRATIILIAHASIFTLADNCFETIGDAFYDFGRTTIGAGLRPGALRL